MKSLFEKYFEETLLKEETGGLTKELTAGLDKGGYSDADTKSLADDVESDITNVKNDATAVEDANSMLKGKIEEKIKEGNDQIASWVEALEEFATFINDPTNEDSIKHIIDNAGTGSALSSVKSTAGAQMIKVATDCVVLAQTLRGLIGSVTVDDVLGMNK